MKKRKLKLLRRPRLIPEWRQAWRYFSMQSMGAAVALVSAYGALPEKLQDALPGTIVITLAVFILLLGMAGRLVDQKR